jgi:hypothetical protein
LPLLVRESAAFFKRNIMLGFAVLAAGRARAPSTELELEALRKRLASMILVEESSRSEVQSLREELRTLRASLAELNVSHRAQMRLLSARRTLHASRLGDLDTGGIATQSTVRTGLGSESAAEGAVYFAVHGTCDDLFHDAERVKEILVHSVAAQLASTPVQCQAACTLEPSCVSASWNIIGRTRFECVTSACWLSTSCGTTQQMSNSSRSTKVFRTYMRRTDAPNTTAAAFGDSLDVDLLEGYGWPRRRGHGAQSRLARCRAKIVGAPQVGCLSRCNHLTPCLARARANAGANGSSSIRIPELPPPLVEKGWHGGGATLANALKTVGTTAEQRVGFGSAMRAAAPLLMARLRAGRLALRITGPNSDGYVVEWIAKHSCHLETVALLTPASRFPARWQLLDACDDRPGARTLGTSRRIACHSGVVRRPLLSPIVQLHSSPPLHTRQWSPPSHEPSAVCVCV